MSATVKHHVSLQTKMPPALLSPARELQRPPTPPLLYLRGTLYYFRFKFPHWLRLLTGHGEIRLSLGTGHLRNARRQGVRLYSELQTLILGGKVLDYIEIKRRLNILLQRDLLEEAKNPDLRHEVGGLEIGRDHCARFQCIRN